MAACLASGSLASGRLRSHLAAAAARSMAAAGAGAGAQAVPKPAVQGARAQPPAPGFTEPDQVRGRAEPPAAAARSGPPLPDALSLHRPAPPLPRPSATPSGPPPTRGRCGGLTAARRGHRHRQVKRFAEAKAAGDPRVLDIDQVYDPSWMAGARVLITGANRGIGLGLAQEAARHGATVVGVCRKASPELEAISGVEVVTGVEVTSMAACEEMAAALAGGAPLDVVINNAGYFPDVADDFTGGLNFEENLKQYDICAVGPLRVTYALVKAGLIREGGKVVNITSQGGSALWRQVQNANEGGDYGHHMCKAAANMCGVLMAEELRPKGIAVANLHPGFNRTGMTRKYEHIWDIEGAVECSVGSKRVMHEIGRVGLLESGAPFINCEDGLLIPY